MKKKRVVTGIIVLMSVTLILIIAMQTTFIVSAYNKSKEIIERNVSEAIFQTISSLKKQDALSYAYYKINSLQSNNNRHIPADPYIYQFEKKQPLSPPLNIDNLYYDKKLSEMFYPFYESFQIDELAHELFSKQQKKFDQLMKEIELEYTQRQIPIEERFDSQTIANILKKSLAALGLDLEFEFAIVDDNNNIKINSSNFDIDRIDKCYKYNIDPENSTQNPNVFLVDFPTKNQYAMESVYAQLAISIVLTLLFVMTFSVSLYALIRQKKLGEIKNDFINNMTHEFKTPIATIKLATASLKNSKTFDNPKTMSNMLDIISQETSRMNHHIEQVLQMAVLDKQNLQIRKTKEDINEIIQDTINNIELVVAEKGGTITLVVIDENVYLNIDRDLITNVFNNLLDNAIKYSKDAPEIKVTSFIEGDKFHVAFKDNGIGMSKEFQTKVFDRFYRAPTGNIHNIKGFGLGLNYAREIILAHKGSINVRSCPGKGSTFTVIFPLK